MQRGGRQRERSTTRTSRAGRPVSLTRPTPALPFAYAADYRGQ